jgi:MoxR-like ATPase
MAEVIKTYEDVRTWKPEATPLAGPGDSTYSYMWSDATRLAVQVALVTGRALLLRGEPGIGKTTLAEAAAATLGWRYYRHTTTSRTEATQILWSVDVVRRLADAQRSRDDLPPEASYLEPRELWWAFDPDSARRRGARADEKGIPDAEDPNAQVNSERSPLHAVVLVDEIDKADPAVANDMLEVLAERRFRVTGVSPPRQIQWRAQEGMLAPLLVLTTNEERDLPEAFLRRCIVHTMTWPADEAGRQFILDVLAAHLGSHDGSTADIASVLLQRIGEEREKAHHRGQRKPGLAELIDAVRAVRHFNVTSKDKLWKELLRLAWQKTPDANED